VCVCVCVCVVGVSVGERVCVWRGGGGRGGGGLCEWAGHNVHDDMDEDEATDKRQQMINATDTP
jgi:hypothetical protein